MMDEDRAAGDDGGGELAPELAYRKALDLLALRPHFRAELVSKLGLRGFEDEVIENCVARLTEQGYLDDLEASRSFARQRVARGGWGPRRLAAELQRRGVDDTHRSAVVEEVFSDGERPAARQAASSWLRSRRLDGGQRERDRLARYLDRRGFSKGTIVEILSEVRALRDGERTEIEHE